MSSHPRPRKSVSHLICPNPSTPLDLEIRDHLFQEILESLDVGVATATIEGKILWANLRFAEILCIEARLDPAGTRLHALIIPHSWQSLDAALAAATRGPAEGEMRIETTSTQRKIHLRLAPVHTQKATLVQIVARDVSKLDEASESLKQTEASLHTLSGRLLRLQDEERRRIARDLHDITGQELAVVVMSLSHLARTIGEAGTNGKQQIEESVEIVRKVEQEIRTLSYLLHPPLLDELGLVSALKWFVEGFNKRTGLEVSIRTPARFDRLSQEKEVALFRVVQESLTNVLRHSGSRRARIELSVCHGKVQVSIEDEGKGMDRETLQKLNSRREILGVGIPGIRERLRQFGGTLRVKSGQRGTLLLAVLPVELKETSEPSFPPEPIETRIPAPAPAVFSERKRILVVDDHEMIRHGIRALLSNYDDLEVCGEAGDGLEAVSKAQDLQPDLVIMDLSLPRLGGLAAANRIKQVNTTTKILIFTTHDFQGMEGMAERSGCDGVVLKRKANQDLVRGVRAVLSDQQFFSHPRASAAASA